MCVGKYDADGPQSGELFGSPPNCCDFFKKEILLSEAGNFDRPSHDKPPPKVDVERAGRKPKVDSGQEPATCSVSDPVSMRRTLFFWSLF